MANKLARISLILSILSTLATMFAVGVLFNGTASANPVAFNPSYPQSLSRVLWDLTDPSRGGQWGRVVVFDQPGSSLYRAADAVGNQVPTFSTRLEGSGYFADSSKVPESMRKYVTRLFGVGYPYPGGWFSGRGILGISGSADQLDRDELSLLGVRYLVATQPLGVWIQPQPELPRVNEDPNNRWPSLHDYEYQPRPPVTYPPPLPANWRNWAYVRTVDGYYIYQNRSAWGRAEFLQSGSYSNRYDGNGIEINNPSAALPQWQRGRLDFGQDDYRNVQVTRDMPGNISIEAYGGRYENGIVVLNEPIVDGWRATVDGRETKIRPVNSVLMGIELPSGRHTIEFHRAHSGPLMGNTNEDSTLYFLAGFLVAALIAGILYFASARRKMFGAL